MRSFLIRLATAALCIVILQPSFYAGEPDGFVRIRPIWTETADPEQERTPEESPGKRLTLEIEAIVPLAETRLSLSVPEAARLRPKVSAGTSVRIERSPRGTRRLTIDLGSVMRRVILEIDVESLPTGGGVGTIIVEGRTEDNRSFREGIGVSLGRERVAGEIRHGAIEYPAGTAGSER